jgi:hypothetical protein
MGGSWEVAVLGTARWRMSTRSSDQANCVEVALTPRRSRCATPKHLTGSALIAHPPAWTAFATALVTARSARACPLDHGTGSRSQILIEATSMVPRNM